MASSPRGSNGQNGTYVKFADYAPQLHKDAEELRQLVLQQSGTPKMQQIADKVPCPMTPRLLSVAAQ